MPYVPLFDPDAPSVRDPGRARPEGDRKRVPVYRYDDDTKLALNVALATGRPLLLRGETGSGKSSLARHVAWMLDLPYYEEVITSRTKAEDLLWTFDALGRLRDAQAQDDKAKRADPYVRPGVLWWAMAREQAASFDPADPGERWDAVRNQEDLPTPPAHTLATAVVLLDEIDKADPDLPNNLLEVLGARRFVVRETGTRVEVTGRPLVFIATNAERELPDAFLRRCITRRLEPARGDALKAIARLHFPADHAGAHGVDDAVIDKVLDRLTTLAAHAASRGQRGPSVAEFLDALRTVAEIGFDEARWEQLTNAVLWKDASPPPKAP